MTILEMYMEIEDMDMDNDCLEDGNGDRGHEHGDRDRGEIDRK